MTIDNPVRAWIHEVLALAHVRFPAEELFFVVIYRADRATAKDFVDAAHDVASLWLTKGADAVPKPGHRLHGLSLIAPANVAAVESRWRAIAPLSSVSFERVTLSQRGEVDVPRRPVRVGQLLRFVCGPYRGRAACGPLARAWENFERAGGVAYVRAERVARDEAPRHALPEKECNGNPTASRRSG